LPDLAVPGTAGAGDLAGTLRHVDRDPQTLATGGDAASARWYGSAVLAVAAGAASRSPTLGAGRPLGGQALSPQTPGSRGHRHSGRTDRAGRLGQLQLRGVGLWGLSNLPWSLVAGHGFPSRF